MTQKTQDLEKFVQAILSKKINVGEVVRQNELCEILDMSLTPLREFLVLLDELGLVEVMPRAGMKIINPDIEFMRENMQFRIMIEMHAIETFIDKVSDDWIDDQISQHHGVLDKLEAAEDLTDVNSFIVDFDVNFHRAIVSSLKNRAVTKAYEYTQTKLRIARQVHRRRPPRNIKIKAMQDHLSILDSLRARDLIKARTFLDAHFTQTIRNTLIGF